MPETAEQQIKTNWGELKQDQAAEDAIVPAMLFVLCKTVTEDAAGALCLNATLVQRVLWEGTPAKEGTPPKTPLFTIGLKGPLTGGTLEERRSEDKVIDATTTMAHATINLVEARIDVQPHWSMFPFRILTGKVELELQAKLVDKDNGEKILLCPDLCTPKDTTEHLDRLVRVKNSPGGMSRSRTLAFLRDMPKIEICEDKRKRRKKGGEGCADDSADDTFVTHPQMTLTFWLHEPVSKATFKIFGPLFLVLVLMLVNFEENFGFGNISECFDQGKKDDHTDYLANVIAIAIAAVVVVPSIRTTSVTSAVHSFTADDLVALVFVVGLALSAWPVCGAALAGCMLSCLVVVGAIVSFVLYTLERKRVVSEACNEPVARLPQKEDDKPSASDFEIDEWARQDESRPQ